MGEKLCGFGTYSKGASGLYLPSFNSVCAPSCLAVLARFLYTVLHLTLVSDIFIACHDAQVCQSMYTMSVLKQIQEAIFINC